MSLKNRVIQARRLAEVAQSQLPIGFEPDGVMFTIVNGEKRYIPYSTKPLVAQDGVGVPSDEDSPSNVKVGESNPEQPKLTEQAHPEVILHCEHCGHDWLGDNDGDEDDTCPKCGAAYGEQSVRVAQSAIIAQVNQMERVVTGVVQTPGQVTYPGTLKGQGLVYGNVAVRDMAWGFLEDMRNDAFSVRHAELKDPRLFDEPPAAATIVESYIAPQDLTINGRMVAQGSWVVSARINDDDAWDQVMSGDLNAFSLVSKDVEFEDVS